MNERPSILNMTVPDFAAEITGGHAFRLSEHRGKKVILYFYPKDNTPGCTAESLQFRDLHARFASAGAEIFGISRDSMRSHEGFKSKLGLPFELISDTDEKVCTMFDVIVMKSMYGKKVRGIERSTFVIDAEGKIVKEWRGVKVPGHVDEVLEFIERLG
ncbi:MAG: bacterioferritin comigratory protein [Pseudomonadota bacterium]|jgi:peroxiredoxin Q/BCP